MTQVREEVSFTKGRIIVRGKLATRGKTATRPHSDFHGIPMSQNGRVSNGAGWRGTETRSAISVIITG